LQGWSPDFIPQLAEQALNSAHIDGYIPIDGNFSLQCAKDLAQQEGIFVGISAGATLVGALKLAETVPPGSNILCMLPDTGERYLSTPLLFDDVASEITTEEQAISCSTPGFRFDVSAVTAPAEDASELDEAAMQQEGSHINQRSGQADYHVCFGISHLEPMFRPLVGSGRGDEDESGRRRQGLYKQTVRKKWQKISGQPYQCKILDVQLNLTSSDKEPEQWRNVRLLFVSTAQRNA
jgi:hypothetical protein